MAMKALPEEQALLLDLQELDNRLRQIEHRAQNLPQIAALKELAAARMTVHATHSTHQGTVEDAAAELRRIESDVAIVESRIARDTERAQSSSSAKDVQALEHELVSLRSRLADLEEMQLAVMEKLEELETVATSTGAELASIDAERARVEAERDELLAVLSGERANAAANRRTVAAKVPAELLALYEKQRERYGMGASLLRGGVSGASGVRLTESDMSSIRAAAPDDVILCPDSNAILIRSNESGL